VSNVHRSPSRKATDKITHVAYMFQNSGSIRLIEEELNLKFRGLDVAKQGQLEARERLLAEMEESARARAEAAEAEGYRLKGLLVHMEHVVGTMRSQGSEEKERLRQEHQRLEAMQMALEADRIALHKRAADEMAIVKQRQKEVGHLGTLMCLVQSVIPCCLWQLEAENHRLQLEKLELKDVSWSHPLAKHH
jgi:hypothetical protein